jgi:AraC-like DNA-binding protein
MVPDIVISEVRMPGLDGFALCRRLKNDELTSHIPIILLGTEDSDRCQLKALEVGADDFIAWPFSASLLRPRMENLLQSRRKLQAHFRKDASLQPRELATNQVDAQFLRRTIEAVEKYMSDFEFDVEGLSRVIFISRRQLLRKLKAVAGCAPNVLIRRLRLKRAAELLRSSGLTVSEITYAVGFSDLKHFRVVFREEYGMSPGEYARRVEEQGSQ